MADDQKPKAMDINDLVRELSKSSTGQGIPPAPTGGQSPAPQAMKPPLSNPKPPMSSPMTGPMPAPAKPPLPKPEAPKPQFSVPPQPITQQKPAPAPSVTPPPATTPGVKEYQSSIRTMGEDISKIRQGQQPAGVPIPRKVEQITPQAPQTAVPKPAMPSPQFKVPSVNLGETQKTGPMAQSKDFSGLKPPVAQGTPKTESKVYIPEGGSGAGNRNVLFLGIGAVALVAGFSYWFFVLRSPAPDFVLETPTPTPTSTPVQNLSAIFANATEIGPVDKISGGEFRTDSQMFKTSGSKAQLLEIIDGVGGKYPAGMLSIFRGEGAIFWYGQKEIFDAKGQIKIGAEPERRMVAMNEISNLASASQVVSSWESTMSDDLKLLITTDKSAGYKGPEVKEFLDNTYRGVAIKYKNFPYSDKSIDYAIVAALNGKNYFVLTASREAMYATIDKLKGF